MTSEDYDDPDVEEAWCVARQAEVADYVAGQRLQHGRIGEWPAWHVAPYVSVWAIESGVTPNAIGWWAICGDLPTDYVEARDIFDPREAVRTFATRWHDLAEAMTNGASLDNHSIGGSPEERRQLAPQLRQRANQLRKWAEDDEVWRDVLDDEG